MYETSYKNTGIDLFLVLHLVSILSLSLSLSKMDLEIYAKNNSNFTWRKTPKNVEIHAEEAPNLISKKVIKIPKKSRERFSQFDQRPRVLFLTR